jgi:hypothetical protein
VGLSGVKRIEAHACMQEVTGAAERLKARYPAGVFPADDPDVQIVQRCRTFLNTIIGDPAIIGNSAAAKNLSNLIDTALKTVDTCRINYALPSAPLAGFTEQLEVNSSLPFTGDRTTATATATRPRDARLGASVQAGGG